MREPDQAILAGTPKISACGLTNHPSGVSQSGGIADALDTTWRTEKLNEAAVRQVIMLRLLQAAGFDLWNPLEVAPEPANLNGGRCDLEPRQRATSLPFGLSTWVIALGEETVTRKRYRAGTGVFARAAVLALPSAFAALG